MMHTSKGIHVKDSVKGFALQETVQIRAGQYTRGQLDEAPTLGVHDASEDLLYGSDQPASEPPKA